MAEESRGSHDTRGVRKYGRMCCKTSLAEIASSIRSTLGRQRSRIVKRRVNEAYCDVHWRDVVIRFGVEAWPAMPMPADPLLRRAAPLVLITVIALYKNSRTYRWGGECSPLGPCRPEKVTPGHRVIASFLHAEA